MNKVLIIGAGAAGLLAGIAAVTSGADVTILEKMPAAGRKLLITGKGRCNLTNDCEKEEFVRNMPGNGRFLNGAFSRFSNRNLVALLEDNGLMT